MFPVSGDERVGGLLPLHAGPAVHGAVLARDLDGVLAFRQETGGRLTMYQ